MNIGGGKVRSERMLLAKVENGKNMMSADSVRFLVLHCSASRCNQDYSVEQLRRDHKARGFYDIGYHFYIRKDGTMTQHRKLLEVGAHARPYNRCSIGICYEGGLDEQGKPCNTMTTKQETRLIELFRNLKILFPKAKIVGHRDLPGTTPKECPRTTRLPRLFIMIRLSKVRRICCYKTIFSYISFTFCHGFAVVPCNSGRNL